MRSPGRACVLAVAALASCSASGIDIVPKPEQRSQAVSAGHRPFTMDALPPQPLGRGGCEVFLFTPRPEPRFVFFIDIDSGVATVSLNKELISLMRIDQSDTGVFDPESMYRFVPADDRFEIVVSLWPLPEVAGQAGGGRGSGVLRITKKDGWMQIAPVSGVSTCAAS